MITATVPALPPSVNHIYLAGGGGRRFLSPAARAWYDLAIPMLRRVEAKIPVKTPISLRIAFYGTSRRTDIDNLLKAAIDAAAKAWGFDDRYIDRLDVVRVPLRGCRDLQTRYELTILEDS